LGSIGDNPSLPPPSLGEVRQGVTGCCEAPLRAARLAEIWRSAFAQPGVGCSRRGSGRNTIRRLTPRRLCPVICSTVSSLADSRCSVGCTMLPLERPLAIVLYRHVRFVLVRVAHGCMNAVAIWRCAARSQAFRRWGLRRRLAILEGSCGDRKDPPNCGVCATVDFCTPGMVAQRPFLVANSFGVCDGACSCPRGSASFS
jgi:hypothetical protein